MVAPAFVAACQQKVEDLFVRFRGIAFGRPIAVAYEKEKAVRLLPRMCAGAALLVFALSAHANSVDPLYQDLGGDVGQIAQSPGPIPCDADGDGRVDGADYMVVKRNFGTMSGAGPSSGDFSGDGAVNWTDLTLLMTTLNAPQTPAAPSAPVPEPLTLGLFALGMVAAGVRWKRRTAADQAV